MTYGSGDLKYARSFAHTVTFVRITERHRKQMSEDET
jgi:hypothetical protein